MDLGTLNLRRVFLPSEYHWRAIQDEISSKHFPGHSNCGLWPTFGNRTSVAFGMRESYQTPILNGHTVSSSPQIKSVSVAIARTSAGLKSAHESVNSRNIASILPGYLDRSHILSTS